MRPGVPDVLQDQARYVLELVPPIGTQKAL